MTSQDKPFDQVPAPKGVPGVQDRSFRGWFVRWIDRGEDGIYAIIGVLLAITALALLWDAGVKIVSGLLWERAQFNAIGVIDSLLITLMVVEILYTVRVSFVEKSLACEPFLVVGLIAAVRRILILTAEVWHLEEVPPELFRMAMIEMGLLTFLILVLVVSIVVLRKHGGFTAVF